MEGACAAAAIRRAIDNGRTEFFGAMNDRNSIGGRVRDETFAARNEQ
jgi:hypothetical protein